MNKTRKNYSKEEARARKLEAFARLKAFWKEYQAMTPEQQQVISKAAAKFGNYSMHNKIMIAFQAAAAGFEPSAVCPMSAWNKVGRTVKKGSKGLAIWVPMVRKGKDAPSADDCALVPFGHDFDIDDGSTPESTHFKIAYVFDISQTMLKGETESETENALPAPVAELPAPEPEPVQVAALPAPAMETDGQLMFDFGAVA